MKNSIFKYDSYKEYLNLTLESLGSGARSKMALAAGCQAGYVTQVLNGDANFSAEHAEKISQFLGHTDSQLHFFLLLVNFERAGTDSLKRYYKKQIEKIKLDQDILKNRMEFQQILSIENQAIFYSSWHYGAIHVAVSIPGCDTEEGLSKYFNIPLQRVSEITSFLENIGLLVRDNLRLKVGPSQVFLGSDSPLISK
ncbi:MAG: TIGR02147 family protein, partial [Bdellovibrionales bacterium]|nr:TIGR02147 family protein [Bdellovibrionales bacterium]